MSDIPSCTRYSHAPTFRLTNDQLAHGSKALRIRQIFLSVIETGWIVVKFLQAKKYETVMHKLIPRHGDIAKAG